MNLKAAEKKIGYVFTDKALLETALTHSSHANESSGDSRGSNERLEFLGDALLGAIIADRLFKMYPDKPEGELTRMRAAVVCEKSLGSVAFSTGLNDELLLGRGEELAGGRGKVSIAADAVEAVIAAVFLDGGIEEARKLVLSFLGEAIESSSKVAVYAGDSKTELQEKLQARGITDIRYEIVAESGPDHSKLFTAAVTVSGTELGRGSGSSKKRAETAAAESALADIPEL